MQLAAPGLTGRAGKADHQHFIDAGSGGKLLAAIGAQRERKGNVYLQPQHVFLTAGNFLPDGGAGYGNINKCKGWI